MRRDIIRGLAPLHLHERNPDPVVWMFRVVEDGRETRPDSKIVLLSRSSTANHQGFFQELPNTRLLSIN